MTTTIAILFLIMLKFQADFLLATYAILECSDRICLNTGTCLNLGALTSRNYEMCVCADGFFGPNCEFTDNDLVMNGLSHGESSISGDGSRRNRRSDIGRNTGISENMVENSHEIQPDCETQIETMEDIETQVESIDHFIVKTIIFQVICAIFLAFLGKWLTKKYNSKLGNKGINVSRLNFKNGRCVIDRSESELNLIM